MMNRPTTILALCAAIPAACSTYSHAQDGPGDLGYTCEPPVLVGSLGGLSYPVAVTVEGDYAYIAQSDDSLVIVDLSDPNNPTLLAHADDLPIQVNDETRIIINQTAAYVDDSIINIEDKTDPWFMRSGVLPLTVTNGYIYYPDGNFAFNVTRPFAPGLDIFTDPLFEFQDEPAGIVDGLLVTTGLERYDISDPLAPVLVAEDPFVPDRDDVYRHEPPHFIVNADNGMNRLHTFQQPLGRFTNDQVAVGGDDFTVRGDIIFSLSEGLQISAVGDPPLPLASFTDDPILASARFIRPLGAYFLVVGPDTLAVYDIPTNPVGGVRTSSHTSFVELMGDTAVLSTGNITATVFTASVVDISNPRDPRWLAELPVAEPFGLASINDTVFVAGKNEGLLAFDLSNPAQPVLSATYNTSIDQAGTPNTRDIFISGHHAYVTDRNSGLTTYTINPDQILTPISILSLNQAAQRVRVQGNLAFVSGFRELFIVDIANPESPVILSTIDELPGSNNFIQTAVMQDKLLYTADENEGYRVHDISNLTNPVQLAHYTLDDLPPAAVGVPEVYDLSIRNNLLYVAASRRGLAIYDNTDPFNPILLRHTEPNADGTTANIARYRDLKFRDNLLFTSAGEAGLRIYDLNDCAGPCTADLNADGVLNFFDVSLFLVAFANNEPSADLEPDGNFNFFDIARYLNAFDAGCP